MHAKLDTTTELPVPVETDLDHRVKIDTKAEDIALEVSEAVWKIVTAKLETQATEQPTVETVTEVPDGTDGIGITTGGPIDPIPPKPTSQPDNEHEKHHGHHRHHRLTQSQRDHIRDCKFETILVVISTPNNQFLFAVKICVKLYNFYPGHTWYRKLCREILRRRF